MVRSLHRWKHQHWSQKEPDEDEALIPDVLKLLVERGKQLSTSDKPRPSKRSSMQFQVKVDAVET